MMESKAQETQNSEPKIIAAIPCFRTEHYIGDVVSRARRHVDQVVVIDDGSDDGTAEVAKAGGALVVSHSTNRGYGKAIKSCFEAAKANNADVLVILDGDGQHNPDNIPQVLTPILNGEADLVIGSRFLGSRVKGQKSLVPLPILRLKTQNSGLRTQDSRLKTLDSRLSTNRHASLSQLRHQRYHLVVEPRL